MHFLVLSLGNRHKVCKGACIGMSLCRTKVLLAYLVWHVAVDPGRRVFPFLIAHSVPKNIWQRS